MDGEREQLCHVRRAVHRALDGILMPSRKKLIRMRKAAREAQSREGAPQSELSENKQKKIKSGKPIHRFAPGNLANPNGRPKGVPNKLTRAAKEAIELAFEGIGGVPALITWAKRHRGEFYKIYARLIPIDLRSSGAPLVSISVGGEPITDVHEAARIHAEFIKNPSLSFDGVQFAPDTSVVAVQTPDRPVMSGDAENAATQGVLQPNDQEIAPVEVPSHDDTAPTNERMKVWQKLGK